MRWRDIDSGADGARGSLITMHTWIADGGDGGDGDFDMEDSGGDGSFIRQHQSIHPTISPLLICPDAHSPIHTLRMHSLTYLVTHPLFLVGFEEEGGFGFFLPSSTRGGFDIGAVTQQVTNSFSSYPSYRHTLSLHPFSARLNVR